MAGEPGGKHRPEGKRNGCPSGTVRRGLRVYACRVSDAADDTTVGPRLRRTVALLTGVAMVGVLLGLARMHATFPGDEWGLREAIRFRTAWLDQVAVVLSAIGAGGIGLGSTVVPWIPMVAVGAMVTLRRWGVAVFLSLAVLAPAVNLGLKELAARPRPGEAWALVEQAGYAFPSGHAVFAAAFFGALLVLLERWSWLGSRPAHLWSARALLVLLVAAVGWSRVHLGVHWPSDVMAGWLVGSLLVCILLAGRDCIERKWQRGP